MKERPILFSGAMVRALLDGTKTQTRRILKVQPSDGWILDNLGTITSKHPKQSRFGVFLRRGVGTDFPQLDLLPCPYGMPGDRLYVRETFTMDDDGYSEWPVFQADGVALPAFPSTRKPARWRPSIHMPRFFSRILLEITSVRVERLGDCSETDAIAEGIYKTPAGFWSTYGQHDVDGTYNPLVSYRSLWESINGAGSWAANPWVWVVEFKRAESSVVADICRNGA